jgi:DNA modification methylase
MAFPAFLSQSQAQAHNLPGTQLDLLSPGYDSPHFPDEEPGTFALSFSPALVRFLIQSFSRSGDTVLDPFLGQGTTVSEALLMGRRAIGVDCNEHFLADVRSGLLVCEESLATLHHGDACHLSALLEPESVDLIVTQPPYGNTYPFSRRNPHDLSLLSGPEFLRAIEKVASELHTVLKPGGICAILIGDIKVRGRMMPLGFQFSHRFLSRGFSVKTMVNARMTNTRLPVPLHPGEYLLVFQKKNTPAKPSRLTC